MKKITRLLVASVALMSATSMAGLIQAVKPVSEDAPFRITTGLKSGLLNNDKGTGINNVGLGLGFAHNVGYDFTYGIAVSGDWASMGRDRVFGGEEAESKNRLWMLDVELSASFMPEVAERLHVGGLLGFGFTEKFGAVARQAKEANKIVFGDMSLRAGLGLSYGFTDMFSMYVAPSYTFTGIRFYASDATEAAKKDRFYSGMEAPVGFWFSASENVGVYVDVNTKFADFSNFTKSWRNDFTLGVAFAI